MDKFTQSALALAIVTAVGLTGCGGGGGAGSTSTTPTQGGGQAQVTGVVADGLLKDAKVCLDRNDNRACDTGEPSATSDAQGRYALAVSVADVAAHSLVAEAIAGVTEDMDQPGVKLTAGYTLVAPKAQPQFISPITTLVQGLVDNGVAPDTTLAAVTLAGQLGVQPTSLTDNFMGHSAGSELDRMRQLGKLVTRALQVNLANLTTAGGGVDAKTRLGLALTPLLDDLASSYAATGGLNAEQLETLIAARLPGLVLAPDEARALVAAPTALVGSWDISALTGRVERPDTLTLFADGGYVRDLGPDGVELGRYRQEASGEIHFQTFLSPDGQSLATLASHIAADEGVDSALLLVSTRTVDGRPQLDFSVVEGPVLSGPGGTGNQTLRTANAGSVQGSGVVGTWVSPQAGQGLLVINLGADGDYSIFDLSENESTGYSGGEWGTYSASNGQLNVGTVIRDQNGDWGLSDMQGQSITYSLSTDQNTLTVDGDSFVRLGSPAAVQAPSGLFASTFYGLMANTYWVLDLGNNDNVVFKLVSSGSNSLPDSVQHYASASAGAPCLPDGEPVTIASLNLSYAIANGGLSVNGSQAFKPAATLPTSCYIND